jgi:glycine/D-amino acid oxidase-like deaminating enzyme
VTDTASVVVIGGGVMGASTAFHLAGRGVRDAVLLERRSLAGGPTGYSSALLRQHYSIELYARMAHESLAFYRAFGDRVGGDCGFVPCGLAVVVGPEDAGAARDVVGMQQAIGIDSRVVSADELRELFGAVRTDDVALAVHERASGYADPVAATRAFARRARDLGVRVREDSPALEVIAEGGRVTGVRTAGGVIATPAVVVAAGPWTPSLLAPLDIKVPIRPSRQQLALLGLPGPARSRPILIDTIQRSYFRPEVANQLFVGVRNAAGVVADADPDDFKPTPDADAVERAVGLTVHRFPDLERAEVRGGYAAIYDLTPDLNFVLDQPSAVAGLWIAAGFSGHGFKHAPIIGRVLAEWVTDGAPAAIDVRPFSMDRFRTGAPTLRGRYVNWPY